MIFGQIKSHSHLFVSVACIARLHVHIHKINAMKTTSGDRTGKHGHEYVAERPTFFTLVNMLVSLANDKM